MIGIRCAVCLQESRGDITAKHLLGMVTKAMSAVRTVVGKETIEDPSLVYRGATKKLDALREKLENTIKSRHNMPTKEEFRLLDAACETLCLPAPMPISADEDLEEQNEQEERDEERDAGDLAPVQERPGVDTPQVIRDAWDLIMHQDELRKSIRFQLLPLLLRVHDNVQSGKDAASATTNGWCAQVNSAR